MAKRRLRPKQLTAEIFKILGKALADNWPSYPRGNIYVVLGEILKVIADDIKEEERAVQKKVLRSLKGLERQKILYIEDKGDKALVWVRNKGKIKVLPYSLKALLEHKKKKKKWDGKWFLVFFDVPEKERKKRDYLRAFLISIGFRSFQKSVYLYPYECEKEISLIKKIVEGGEYINYIVADKIENEEKFIRAFRLKKSIIER